MARHLQTGDVVRTPAGTTYTLGRVAGSGHFGVVFVAKADKDGAAVAIKVPKASKDAQELMEEEVGIMRAVDAGHPACPLVRLVDVVLPRGVVCQHMDGGDMEGVVLPWPALRPLYAMACRGVAWLHARGYIHCDIKPENMLLNAAKTELRVCDLGNAQEARLKNQPPRSTFYYRAPESLLELPPYGPGVDVWALACCMYETFTGEILFTVDDLTEEDEDAPSRSSSSSECESVSGTSTDEDDEVQWVSSSSSESDEEETRQDTLAHLGQLQAVCGPLPRAWRKAKRRFFNARGELFPFEPPPPFGSLESKLEHDCSVEAAPHAPAVLALLRACLRYKARPATAALEAMLVSSAPPL